MICYPSASTQPSLFAQSAESPLALTDSFSSDRVKATQWNAFIRKNRLSSEKLFFQDVTAFLRDFLVPPVPSIQEGQDSVHETENVQVLRNGQISGQRSVDGGKVRPFDPLLHGWPIARYVRSRRVTLKVHVPELDGESPVQNLGAESVSGLVYVHRTRDVQVGRQIQFGSGQFAFIRNIVGACEAKGHERLGNPGSPAQTRARHPGVPGQRL